MKTIKNPLHHEEVLYLEKQPAQQATYRNLVKRFLEDLFKVKYPSDVFIWWDTFEQDHKFHGTVSCNTPYEGVYKIQDDYLIIQVDAFKIVEG